MHMYRLCNNTPRAVKHYTWGEAANPSYEQSSKGCHLVNIQVNQTTNNPKPNPRTQPSFDWVFRLFSPQCEASKLQVQKRVQSIQSNFKLSERRMQCKSNFGRMQHLCFGLNRACGRTCKVEKKVVAHYKGQRFHAASKVLVDARELAKAKRFELKQNAEFNWF